MESSNTPTGGQPVNSKVETSATRSGAIRMSVQIPTGWNPHADLLAIADLASAAGKRADRLAEQAEEAEEAGHYRRAEDLREAARCAITRENVREINFAVCLLAMRLSGCRISIPAEEQSPDEILAEIGRYTGPRYGRASEAHAARIGLKDHPEAAEESLRATLAAIHAEDKAEVADLAAKAAARALDRAKEGSAK